MEIRKNPTVKVLAFLTAVVAFAAAAVMGCYQLANFDAIWNEDGSVSDGCTVRRLLAQDEDDIRSLISYYTIILYFAALENKRNILYNDGNILSFSGWSK